MCSTAHQKLLLCIHTLAEPAGTATLNGTEMTVGMIQQAKGVPRLQVIERQFLTGMIVGVVVTQQLINLRSDSMAEGDTVGIAYQKCLNICRKYIEIPEQLHPIGLLPFMSVRLDSSAIGQVGVVVSHLVEHHHKEMIGVEVAVDAILVVLMTRLRPAIVAQLAATLRGDMQEDMIAAEIVEDRLHRCLGKIAGKDLPVLSRYILFHNRPGTERKPLSATAAARKWGSRNGGACGAWACVPLWGCNRQRPRARMPPTPKRA